MSTATDPRQVISRRVAARRQHTDFDWQQFDELSRRNLEINRSRTPLGQDRSNRRLGRTFKVSEAKPELKPEEKAVLVQGNALIQSAWTDLEQVKAAVYAAYKGGNDALDNHEMNAVAIIAHNMKLDPSPGVGHLYAWKEGGRFMVQIGYQGYIFKGQQERPFVHTTRAMTASERAEHGLKDDETGAVCELYDLEKSKQWRAIGLEPKPIIGIAVFRPKPLNEKDRKDRVPRGRTALWVCEKNATKDAIRQLGLGFGSMVIPDLSGYEYDRAEDTFIRIDDGNTVEGEKTEPPNAAPPEPDEPPAPPDDAIEGEYTEARQEQPQPDASESPAPKSEGSEQPKPSKPKLSDPPADGPEGDAA